MIVPSRSDTVHATPDGASIISMQGDDATPRRAAWLRRQAIEARRALDQALQTADTAQLAEAIADAHRMLGVSIAEPGAEETP